MSIRMLHVGLLGVFLALPACVAIDEDIGGQENVIAAEQAVLSGVYLYTNRQSQFPLGSCGTSNTSNKADRQLNSNNAPYKVDWQTSSQDCVKLVFNNGASSISGACSSSDGAADGTDYTAACNAMGTNLHKIVLPLLDSDASCLTAFQDANISNLELYRIGSLRLKWTSGGVAKEVAAGSWNIFRKDSSSGARYFQYDLYPNGGSGGKFLNDIQSVDSTKTNLDGVQICMEKTGVATDRLMPASYHPYQCVGFDSTNSSKPSWYPANKPAGLYAIAAPYSHAWCPVNSMANP